MAQNAVPPPTSTPSAAPRPTLGLTMALASQAVLSEHPLLRIQQQQVDLNEGLRLQASAAFDTVIASQLLQRWTTQPLTAYQQASDGLDGSPGSIDRSAETILEASLSRTFRSGIALGGNVEVDRLLDNISGAEGNSFGTFNLTATIPLLRNRGFSVVAAQETAAREEVEAARKELVQQASQLLENAGTSYWNLLAGEQLLVIAQQSEDRARVYLSNVQALAAADQVPRSDLSQVEANLAQRSSNRIAAEQSVSAAQQQLALDLGMTLAELNNIDLQPGEPFPAIASEAEVAAASSQRTAFLAMALIRRGDLLASEQRVAEQQALAVAARNRLKPQLDLGGTAGYAGLQPGRKLGNAFGSLGTDVRGPNAQASLTFSFPFSNEAARGVLVQVLASQHQAELTSEQLRHQISTQVNTALSALIHAARQVVEATHSVQASQASLDGEREKYRVGVGSIVDVVTVEDRLNTALADEVGARLSYALALVQLRFATSTFLDRNGATMQLQALAFESIPAADAAQPGASTAIMH